MTFLSDALRVAGIVTGAALASTGVASPLGAALIGAAVSVPANAGASAIDRSDASKKLDKAESQAKNKVDAEAKREQERLQNEQQRLREEAEHRRAQAVVANQILELCTRGEIQQIPQLLQQLDQHQFEDLGLRPLAACPTQVVSEQVAQMIADEEVRRNNSRRPRP